MNVVSWFLLALVVVLSGCASPLTSGVGSAGTLEFKTSERNGTPFRAADRGRVIAAARAQGGSVTFQLPAARDTGPCVSIHNAEGKNVFPNGASVYTAVRAELKETSDQLQRANAELSESRRSDPRLLIASTQERLTNNRAFVNQQCTQPEQRAIPNKPVTRCTSRQECVQDGAAICFTRYLGEKGCGAAFSEFRVPGILSGPGCAAAAAKLAGEKYELGDAFVDAMMGIIEDAGASLRESDSLLDNILGGAIRLGAEAKKQSDARSCTDSFVRRHFGPLEAWQANVQSIVTEPERLFASCQKDHDSLPLLAMTLIMSTIPANTDRLEEKVAELRRRQRTLEAERRPLEFCKAG